MGFRANRQILTRQVKDFYANMVSKEVTVNSYNVHNKTGIVKSYIRSTNHFWVYLDEEYKTLSGKMSRWHKCNCGNVKLK